MLVHELDTPALVIDLDIMERNLSRAADYARSHGLRLRPHTKTHKSPALARRQLDFGAAGLTVAKVGEAEVMLESGDADLLVAYPVVGARKLERLMRVAAETEVTVSLDSERAAQELSDAAVAAKRTVGVLAEIDVGLGRVGVEPGPRLQALVSTVSRLPCLRFEGVAFYPGHIKKMGESADASLASLAQTLETCIRELEKSGFEVRIVSGGSTPTLFRSHTVARQNEIRPGTYIFNDRNTWLSGACDLGDCAASIVTTVVSTAVKDQIVIDGGSKTFSSDRSTDGSPGFGYFPEAPQAVLEKMNEEHGYVSVGGIERNWKVGERLRVIPNHICVAVNLHEQIYGVRGEQVEEVWDVKARGKLQ